MKNLEKALEYRKMGLSVIPVKPDKKPFESWTRYQGELAQQAYARGDTRKGNEFADRASMLARSADKISKEYDFERDDATKDSAYWERELDAWSSASPEQVEANQDFLRTALDAQRSVPNNKTIHVYDTGPYGDKPPRITKVNLDFSASEIPGRTGKTDEEGIVRSFYHTGKIATEYHTPEPEEVEESESRPQESEPQRSSPVEFVANPAVVGGAK